MFKRFMQKSGETASPAPPDSFAALPVVSLILL